MYVCMYFISFKRLKLNERAYLILRAFSIHFWSFLLKLISICLQNLACFVQPEQYSAEELDVDMDLCIEVILYITQQLVCCTIDCLSLWVGPVSHTKNCLIFSWLHNFTCCAHKPHAKYNCVHMHVPNHSGLAASLCFCLAFRTSWPSRECCGNAIVVVGRLLLLLLRCCYCCCYIWFCFVFATAATLNALFSIKYKKELRYSNNHQKEF